MDKSKELPDYQRTLIGFMSDDRPFKLLQRREKCGIYSVNLCRKCGESFHYICYGCMGGISEDLLGNAD